MNILASLSLFWIVTILVSTYLWRRAIEIHKATHKKVLDEMIEQLVQKAVALECMIRHGSGDGHKPTVTVQRDQAGLLLVRIGCVSCIGVTEYRVHTVRSGIKDNKEGRLKVVQPEASIEVVPTGTQLH
jgi:hypothetical protein